MSRSSTSVLRAVLAITTAVPARALHAQVAFPPALEVRVPKPPTVTHGGGETVLPYELHVTNVMGQPIQLQRIEVVSADNNATLMTMSDSMLQRAAARPGTRIPPTERLHVAPGLRVVVYMWVPVTGGPPHAIRHRLTVLPDSGAASPLTLETASVPVMSDLLVIAPPLRGGPWLAANGPSAESGHRRALIPISGALNIAQRFAIDWVKVDARYSTHSGDSLKNSSYYAYGNDALAVADGIVTEVKDSIPENVPGINSRAVPITLETVGGNHVIVDIGGGCTLSPAPTVRHREMPVANELVRFP